MVAVKEVARKGVKVKVGDWILIEDDKRIARFTICIVKKTIDNKLWDPWIGRWYGTIGECIKKMDVMMGADDNDYFTDINEREITVLPKNRKKREELLVQMAVLEAL